MAKKKPFLTSCISQSFVLHSLKLTAKALENRPLAPQKENAHLNLKIDFQGSQLAAGFRGRVSVKSSFYVVESSDFVLRSRVIRWSIGSKHTVPMERRAWDSPAAPTTAGWSLFQPPPQNKSKWMVWSFQGQKIILQNRWNYHLYLPKTMIRLPFRGKRPIFRGAQLVLGRVVG